MGPERWVALEELEEIFGRQRRGPGRTGEREESGMLASRGRQLRHWGGGGGKAVVWERVAGLSCPCDIPAQWARKGG